MKKVVIIGSLESGTKNDPRILSEHLRKRGIDVISCFWEELAFDIRTGDVKIKANENDIAQDIRPDLVIAVGWYKIGRQLFYRDIAYATALYLEKAGITFWNSEMGVQRSTTKLSCMVQLALSDVPVPSTSFSINTTLLDVSHPPFVIKAIAASRGENNFLVHSTEEAERILAANTTQYLLQPFIPNDHDLRVICFGGEPSLVLRRSRASDATTHLNNTSQGGNAEWLDATSLDEKLLTLCRKICIITGREMGGIDLIPDSSSPFGYSCLEVNAIPQLTSGHDNQKKLDMLADIIQQGSRGVSL